MAVKTVFGLCSGPWPPQVTDTARLGRVGAQSPLGVSVVLWGPFRGGLLCGPLTGRTLPCPGGQQCVLLLHDVVPCHPPPTHILCLKTELGGIFATLQYTGRHSPSSTGRGRARMCTAVTSCFPRHPTSCGSALLTPAVLLKETRGRRPQWACRNLELKQAGAAPGLSREGCHSPPWRLLSAVSVPRGGLGSCPGLWALLPGL